MERSSLCEFEAGCHPLTCSAEDLLILKLFALRPHDVADAGTIATRQRDRFDWGYIEAHLAPLAEAKEQPEILLVAAKLRGGSA